MSVAVFPNVPRAPGMACQGEDSKYIFVPLFTSCAKRLTFLIKRPGATCDLVHFLRQSLGFTKHSTNSPKHLLLTSFSHIFQFFFGSLDYSYLQHILIFKIKSFMYKKEEFWVSKWVFWMFPLHWPWTCPCKKNIGFC